jgi:single-stranded-DNA-specific exonuclease
MVHKLEKEWVVKGKMEGAFSFEKLLHLVLQNREIEDVETFLHPDISRIPSFKKLHDSLGAAKKIVEAMKKKKRIVIYGDYDVDGISGTCLLWSFLYFELSEFLKLEKSDLNILPYIPDRVDEGYGLSTQSLEKLVEQRVDLIVTVDCGIRDKELIKTYPDIDFIVTDHHLPPEDILKDLDYTIVHQLFPGKAYPFASVCGAFVVFLLILAIKDAVGMESSFEKNTQYLDLVALPTVTDIMPLKDVNRIVVKHGLEVLREGERIGLRKLSEKAQVEVKDISTYHLGYILGPRLNASGRIDSGIHALRLLSTKSESQAKELSSKLDSLNFERQMLTKEILDIAREKVFEKKLQSLIFVKGVDWNEGVIGLVAGRLQEEFHRPVLVVTQNENEIKGSARSVNGFNITEAIGMFEKYLIKFGGHNQAAGFSVKEGCLEDFEKEITEYVDANVSEELFKKVLDIDCVLDTQYLNMELAEHLSRLEPFGYGNKKPMFLLEKVVVVSKKVLGKDANHMKLEIQGNASGVDEAIMFNCAECIEKIKVDDVLDLVGYVGINQWNGLTKVQFEIKDWKACNGV